MDEGFRSETPPQIALLGWGSLLWDRDEEFDRWHDEWRYDGPTLKLEFSRISDTRLGALTLVIDPQVDIANKVAWCLSKRKKPEDAVADLRCREGTTLENIGRLVLAESLPSDDLSREIAAWAKERKLDVVVWTALESNFATKVGHRFCVKEAIAYLKRLPPEGKAKAAEYIWRAPGFIRTPLRSAVEIEPWFPAGEGN